MITARARTTETGDPLLFGSLSLKRDTTAYDDPILWAANHDPASSKAALLGDLIGKSRWDLLAQHMASTGIPLTALVQYGSYRYHNIVFIAADGVRFLCAKNRIYKSK